VEAKKAKAQTVLADDVGLRPGDPAGSAFAEFI
jgi:hypothetical protein